MMQNFCRRCGAEILMRKHVGRCEDGEFVCIDCVQEEERSFEAYMNSDEYKLECMINRTMMEDAKMILITLAFIGGLFLGAGVGIIAAALLMANNLKRSPEIQR